MLGRAAGVLLSAVAFGGGSRTMAQMLCQNCGRQGTSPFCPYCSTATIQATGQVTIPQKPPSHSEAPGSQPEGVLFTLVGFVVGVGLGLGLCWLAFSFEFTGGPSSGVTIRALGVSVFTTHGLFVDFVPAIVYVLLGGLTGIWGAIVGRRH